jgi:hypothetical protein
MSAPLDPVNATPRPRIGGRYKPPSEKLTGRTGACDILGIDKRGLRRLEDKGVLKPAVVQPNGVRWFDIETVWRLAVERQKAGVKPRPRTPRSRLPEGVQRVTGTETRRINEWFAAGLSHAEVVMRSGKTNETIRYLYAQYVTPSGGRVRMTAPGSANSTLDPPAYFPEHGGAAHAARPVRAEPLPPSPSHALPHRAPTAATRPVPASATPASPRRTLTQVPDSWFTAPISPVADDDNP